MKPYDEHADHIFEQMLIGLCSVPASKACVVDCNKYRKKKKQSPPKSRGTLGWKFPSSQNSELFAHTCAAIKCQVFQAKGTKFMNKHIFRPLYESEHKISKKTLNNKCQRAFQWFMNISRRCVLSTRMELRLALFFSFNMSLHNVGVARMKKASRLDFGLGKVRRVCHAWCVPVGAYTL